MVRFVSFDEKYFPRRLPWDFSIFILFFSLFHRKCGFLTVLPASPVLFCEPVIVSAMFVLVIRTVSISFFAELVPPFCHYVVPSCGEKIPVRFNHYSSFLIRYPVVLQDSLFVLLFLIVFPVFSVVFQTGPPWIWILSDDFCLYRGKTVFRIWICRKGI